MSILCYNCRGLGNDPAVVRLRGLLRGETTDVVVLLETKLSSQEIQGVIKRLGGVYDGVGVDSVGRSAGVAILWREGVEVDVISSTAHHIDEAIRGVFNVDEWRLTGVYGWSRHEDKWKTWRLMKDIKSLSSLPWVMIGDFNQILFEHEKKGGAPREQALMDEFREAVDECELLDVGFSDVPTITLHHLEFDKSDHMPIKLAMFSPIKSFKGKRFRFEDMWVTSEGCEEVVRESWVHSGALGSGQDALYKLGACSRKLSEWSKIQFGDLRKQIEETRKRMHFLDSCPPLPETVNERKGVC
ncbi:uncharacterized protein LOC141638656 [Silene latifolia]|uniref:uncharacterized protein LOC141638656 n=1 Tax=Silene latifolia TaxID=37657 RepID=UPI003D7792E8